MINRKQKYKDIINDLAVEISNSNYWRRKIFDSEYNEEINISYQDEESLPEYIRKEIAENKLEFTAAKIKDSEKMFDDDLVVFRFRSKEFPDVTEFSGNNPKVK